MLKQAINDCVLRHPAGCIVGTGKFSTISYDTFQQSLILFLILEIQGLHYI